jgi:glucose-1-phosphate thymidylyltransferase
MKGLILSGGTGSRLRPLTHTSAKQLIPVANKPVLFYAIEALVEAGVTDIGLVVGETRRDIQAAAGDGARWGARLTYIPQSSPLGLAHAVGLAREFLAGEPFIVYLGDNLVGEGVKNLVSRFEETAPDALILLSRVDEPQRFGVAELRDGKVVRLVEKPKVPASDLALVGVYLFRPRIFEAIAVIEPSWRNELEITDAIQKLVDWGSHVEPHMLTGWWKDTGKPEDILEANRLVLETLESSVAGAIDGRSQVTGRAVIETGATITGSVIRGPVIIGSGAVIEDSYVGPFTSIGPGVRIVGTEIEYSVVMAGSTLTAIPGRIDRSLIGRDVVIGETVGSPRAFRLVLGDNCRAEIGWKGGRR